MKLILNEKCFKPTALLIIFSSLVYVFGLFPNFVEKWYTLGFYPFWGHSLRFCFGWIPFSIGDIGYLLFLIWLGLICYKGIKRVKQIGFSSIIMIQLLKKMFHFFLFSYLIFKLSWGLNYNRSGIANQVGIKKLPYTKELVTTITNKLIDSANLYRILIGNNTIEQPVLINIYAKAVEAYQFAADSFPFLKYNQPSIKASIFTPIADFIGFTGYYNPISGEAQLRTDIPLILIPFTVCHEIAHQIGYASEAEASFVGYLAAKYANDPYLKYSVYFEMLQYALAEQYLLYAKESNYSDFVKMLEQNQVRINSLVKRDKKIVHDFFVAHKQPISSIADSMYDRYLKINQQSKGIGSYNEVVAWLIAYERTLGFRPS